MKNNQVIAVMTGIFFVCAVVTFFNIWNYHVSLKQLGEWEARANYVRILNPELTALLNDTAEYSKKNPAVVPILQSLTNGTYSGAATAKPAATKPATK